MGITTHSFKSIILSFVKKCTWNFQKISGVTALLMIILTPTVYAITFGNIYKYKLFGGSAFGVMVIVIGNGHVDTSSYPGQSWLHFT